MRAHRRCRRRGGFAQDRGRQTVIARWCPRCLCLLWSLDCICCADARYIHYAHAAPILVPATLFLLPFLLTHAPPANNITPTPPACAPSPPPASLNLESCLILTLLLPVRCTLAWAQAL
ncbi:hypothetical protein P154DRAFT_39113 [Amniculicola lignicola CBS 123094]|uniref:Uncharacterized protein n=1 Tax=Amniculicola lignicola CBS 123094 TaxID=1392246 RepID=A0A6A5W4Y7_9PLEO|nr:hypothetical protein P154DRAFT_39113 [Amniculicola lignicola CBS 123094]